jgi:hypothetical protein
MLLYATLGAVLRGLGLALDLVIDLFAVKLFVFAVKLFVSAIRRGL